MTASTMVGSSGLPLAGTAFLHFALNVVDLLEGSEPDGLDQDRFLTRYFAVYMSGSPPPSDIPTRDAWWDEFKRARDYSNEHFNRFEVLWAFIRAEPGSRRGQYYYHVVARREVDRAEIKASAASLSRLDAFTTPRWRTQTGSRQRVRAAEGLAFIEEGNRTGNTALAGRGQAILDEIITLSPGLAAINFDTGIVMDDLRRLAVSTNPHVQLLRKQIHDALRSGSRFEKDTTRIVHGVLALADVYQKGSMKSLP